MLARRSASTPAHLHGLSNVLRAVHNLGDMGADALAFFARVHAESGDVAWFPFGFMRGVLLARPEFAQSVLVDNDSAFQKLGYLRVFFRPVLGEGLLTSEGDQHRRQRRLMAPAFTPGRIAGYASIMAEYAQTWCGNWQDGQIVEMHQEMMALTLCIVGKVLFNTDMRAHTGAVGQALGEVIELGDRRAGSLLPIPEHWPTPTNRRFTAAIARLDALVFDMIAERRARPDLADILSVLLESRDEDGGVMTDRQIRDEAMTLLLAGHETTANAMTWTWYLLSQHPDIYDRLRAEIDTVLQGRVPGFADLPALPYTLQVVKEAMRLYPPVWVVGRTSLVAVDIGGIAVPPQTEVLLPIFLLHRQASSFPDPDLFEPARFAPENEARLPRFAYMPFGGGSRVCIGNHFAMVEAQLILATMAQRVVLERADDPPIERRGMITLRPAQPLRMRVHRRPEGSTPAGANRNQSP